MPSYSPKPSLPVPEGECRTETPDGVQFSTGPNGGFNNLYDTGGSRPAIPSGDWQVRPPGMKPRGRP